MVAAFADDVDHTWLLMRHTPSGGLAGEAKAGSYGTTLRVIAVLAARSYVDHAGLLV